jgi:hypothetical protein
MSAVPLDIVAEPVIGWRGWFLRVNAFGPELVPAGKGRGGWPWRAPMTARCAEGRGHRSPDPSCGCGLSAFKPETAHRSLRSRFPVIGTVSMWGRIVEHQHGWRAEHAYPERLRLVCGTCLRARTGRRTGIPVIAGTVAGDAASQGFASAWCDVHVPSELSRAWSAPEVGRALLSRYAVDPMPIARIEATVGRPRRRRPWTNLDRVETTTMRFEPPDIVRHLR